MTAVPLRNDGAGATVKLRSQTFTVAQYCVRRKAGADTAGGVDWEPAPGNLDVLDGMPSGALGETYGDDRLCPQRGGGSNKASAASSREWPDAHEEIGSSSPFPATVPVPAPRSFPLKLPSSAPFSVRLLPMSSPFDENCTQLPATVDARGEYER